MKKAADPPQRVAQPPDAKTSAASAGQSRGKIDSQSDRSTADTVSADVKPPVADQARAAPTESPPAIEDTAKSDGAADKQAGDKDGDPIKDPDADKKADADKFKDIAKDPYAVPDGSPAELLKFIDELSGYRPKVASREAALEHVAKQHKAINTAVDKILAAKPEDDVRAQALKKKLQISWFVANTVDRESLPKFEELARELAKDKNAEVAGEATLYLLAIAMRSIAHDKPAEAKAVVAQFTDALNKQPLDERLPGLALNVPLMLEQAGHMNLARDAAQQFIAALKQSKSEQLAPIVEQLEAALKKLELIGKPLDIEGTLVDGKKFDWSSYKGKVVLVDFWATWCGPCLAELPNVRKTYETYHDRGFEVVGISLDEVEAGPDGKGANLEEARAKMAKFLTDEKVPWPILLGTTPEASGWNHPMAKRYGIDGIPAAFLVNKEGNLVTMNARGEALPQMVAELLGAAPAGAKDSAAEEKPASGP